MLLLLLAWLILLVVVSVCVVFCVLCSNQQPDDCTFFSGHNFFQFCNNWCSYFDTTDHYLKFISTVGQMTVPFFQVVIFSGCNLNPLSSCWLLCLCVLCFVFCAPTNDQMTVPFFRWKFFQFCNNKCLYFDTTDGYLRFISTVGQMTVPFFSGRNFFRL